MRRSTMQKATALPPSNRGKYNKGAEHERDGTKDLRRKGEQAFKTDRSTQEAPKKGAINKGGGSKGSRKGEHRKGERRKGASNQSKGANKGDSKQKEISRFYCIKGESSKEFSSFRFCCCHLATFNKHLELH